MSDYCKFCGCRQPDPQRSNLDHYTNCQNAPPGAILHLKRRDQDECDRAADEIARLKGGVAQHEGCKRALGRVIRENTARADEIEQLRDDAIHNEGVMVALREGYTEAKARREELESENESIRAKIVFLRDGCHHITPEMIDAVVEYATAPSDQEWERSHFELLNHLNIFRCEGCDGKGKTYSRSGSMKEEPMEWIHLACNGHGWVIGGEDG